MYILKAEASFDAAHFLAGYKGKCGNIHGHRWRVVIKVQGLQLKTDKQSKGMLIDFARLKKDVKEETDSFDHMLMVEKNTLKPATAMALKEEGFQMVELDFRPTAENLAKYFFDRMGQRGYEVKSVAVYETPNNCAIYEK